MKTLTSAGDGRCVHVHSLSYCVCSARTYLHVYSLTFLDLSRFIYLKVILIAGTIN